MQQTGLHDLYSECPDFKFLLKARVISFLQICPVRTTWEGICANPVNLSILKYYLKSNNKSDYVLPYQPIRQAESFILFLLYAMRVNSNHPNSIKIKIKALGGLL